MPTSSFAQAQWLNLGRVTAHAKIFLVLYILVTITWLVLSPRLVDPLGKPIGTDFINVWTAGKQALMGQADGTYDFHRHFAVQDQAMPWRTGQQIPHHVWIYPPVFLLVAASLALMPYGPALATWMAVTLPLFLVAVRTIIPYRQWFLFALSFPGTFVTLAHGQNGFLTTGLIGGGLLLLERRPILAGILFGMQSYKPQFGLLIPIVLLFGWHRRAFFAATLTTLGLALISISVFGTNAWSAFFGSLQITRVVVVEHGISGWEKMLSTFAAVRLLGGGLEIAYALQAVVSLVVVVTLIWVWRRPVGMALKGSALVTATIIATPYGFDYDLILLALPISWLAIVGLNEGFLPWEKLVLLAAWCLPLVSRIIGAIGFPIAPVVLGLLFVVILRRVGLVALKS